MPVTVICRENRNGDAQELEWEFLTLDPWLIPKTGFFLKDVCNPLQGVGVCVCTLTREQNSRFQTIFKGVYVKKNKKRLTTIAEADSYVSR